MRNGFSIKPVKVRNGEFTYRSFRLVGWLNGARLRKQFQDRAEAEGEKSRLEVEAANRDGAIRPINSRLTTEQVRAAEGAFGRIGNHPLAEVVDYFLKNFRPPIASAVIETAAAEFMRD